MRCFDGINYFIKREFVDKLLSDHTKGWTTVETGLFAAWRRHTVLRSVQRQQWGPPNILPGAWGESSPLCCRITITS